MLLKPYSTDDWRMMNRIVLGKLDRNVLFAQLTFWLLTSMMLYTIFKDVKDFGQVTDTTEDHEWITSIMVSVLFYKMLKLIWENTLSVWRTPVIALLALLILYDIYVFAVVGYDQRDMTRLILDTSWLILLLSLYNFRPLIKQV